MYARTGAGPPDTLAFFQNAMPVRVVLGHANSTNGAAGPHDLKGCLDSLLKPSAFQDGMCSMLGELADALDRFLAALTHDVGCAELLSEGGPLWVAAEQDDALGPKALRRDHTA